MRDVALLGLRLGGTVAALAAEHAEDVSKLILWSPIIRGHDYVEELFRRWAVTHMVNRGRSKEETTPFERLSRDGTLEVEGHLLTRRMHDELMAVDLTNGARKYRGSLFLGGMKNATKRHEQYERLAKAYESRGNVSAVSLVEDEKCWTLEALFAGQRPERLYAETLAWLLRSDNR